MRVFFVAGTIVGLFIGTSVLAEPPKGVTPIVIGRATFPAFDLKSAPLALAA